MNKHQTEICKDEIMSEVDNLFQFQQQMEKAPTKEEREAWELKLKSSQIRKSTWAWILKFN